MVFLDHNVEMSQETRTEQKKHANRLNPDSQLKFLFLETERAKNKLNFTYALVPERDNVKSIEHFSCRTKFVFLPKIVASPEDSLYGLLNGTLELTQEGPDVKEIN